MASINFPTLSILSIVFGLGISMILSEDLEADAIVKNFYQAETNWTDYSLSVKTREVIPPIDINSKISNLVEARRVAYENAQATNRSRLSISLESLLLNEDYTLGEYLEEEPRWKDAYLNFFNSRPEKMTRNFDKKYLVLTSKVSFLGPGNLMSLFYRDWGGDDLPEVRDSLPEEKYSGFILDARGMGFRPSLFPKIQVEDGRDILNNYIAYPSAIQEIGLVRYMNHEDSRETRKRVGNTAMRIVPIYITGKNRTNLVIPMDEAVKILASPNNRKNWKLCKIIVLVD